MEQVQGFQADGGEVSSSAIREALLGGKLEEANKLLGYEYSLSGTVIEGRRLGRTIGFPTANIKPVDLHKLIPRNGVYAVEVNLGGEVYPGMLSIGSNPTVNSDSGFRSIEVHILNFGKDIIRKTDISCFQKKAAR